MCLPARRSSSAPPASRSTCSKNPRGRFDSRKPAVRSAFRLLALKSGGEYFEFDPEKPRAVEQLSSAIERGRAPGRRRYHGTDRSAQPQIKWRCIDALKRRTKKCCDWIMQIH